MAGTWQRARAGSAPSSRLQSPPEWRRYCVCVRGKNGVRTDRTRTQRGTRAVTRTHDHSRARRCMACWEAGGRGGAQRAPSSNFPVHLKLACGAVVARHEKRAVDLARARPRARGGAPRAMKSAARGARSMPSTVPSALAMGVAACVHAEAGRASERPGCGAVGVAPRFPLHSCRTPFLAGFGLSDPRPGTAIRKWDRA